MTRFTPHTPSSSFFSTSSPDEDAPSSDKTKPASTDGNAFVDAINAKFGLKKPAKSEQHACVARAAAQKPTFATAHTSPLDCGLRAGGGGGKVWTPFNTPTKAAESWFGSPPHAAIINNAGSLACGAGPSSAVCYAYRK